MGAGQQGWFQDPFGLHEERYFSAGRPTKLVRDGQVEHFDAPPSTTSEQAAAVAGEGGKGEGGRGAAAPAGIDTSGGHSGSVPRPASTAEPRPASVAEPRPASVAGPGGGLGGSNIFDPNAKLIMTLAEHDARLRSRGEVTAAGVLRAVASVAPLLVGMVCKATQEAVDGLLDDGVPAADHPGNGLAARPRLSDDLKAALEATARMLVTRERPAGTQATPAHLLAGLVEVPDSSAVRMLIAAGIDLTVAQRRAGLLLDRLQGPMAVISRARPARRGRLAGPRSQQADPSVADQTADRGTGNASDNAAVSGYAAYAKAVAEATRALDTHDYQAAAEIWHHLYELYRLEPVPRLEAAGFFFQTGRVREATACLGRILSSPRNGWCRAMASNIHSWSSVVDELVASGAVSQPTLDRADQAMQDARAYRALVPGSVGTVALIRTLQGRPADAVALLSPRLARAGEPADATAQANRALEEITCALAHRALGHAAEASRLLAASRRRKVHPALGPLNVRYLQSAGRAVELGQVPCSSPAG